MKAAFELPAFRQARKSIWTTLPHVAGTRFRECAACLARKRHFGWARRRAAHWREHFKRHPELLFPKKKKPKDSDGAHEPRRMGAIHA